MKSLFAVLIIFSFMVLAAEGGSGGGGVPDGDGSHRILPFPRPPVG